MYYFIFFFLLINMPVLAYSQPTEPLLATVTSGTGTFTLTWQQLPGPLPKVDEDFFAIYKKNDTGNFQFLASNPRDVFTWVESGVTIGKEYCYLVLACNLIGCTSPSNIACQTIQPPTTDLLPPANLAVQNVPEGFKLTWGATPSIGTGFRVERGTSSSMFPIALLGFSIHQYIDSAVSIGKNYCYQIRTEKAGKLSPPSNVVCLPK